MLFEQTPSTANWLSSEFAPKGNEVLFLLSQDMPNIAHIMKDWEYTFDPVSKAEWIRQITSDLKQKPIESLVTEWWEGEPRWPVLHSEDMEIEVVRLPDFLFNQPPQITEKISATTSSPEAVNQTILEALQFGTQSIILQIEASVENFNTQWIKDVRLDWITFQVEHVGISATQMRASLKIFPSAAFFRMMRGDQSKPLSSILSVENRTSETDIAVLRFIYLFPSEGIWTEKVITTLNALIDDLQQWEAVGFETSTFFNQCILIIEADQDYFKQIIQTRALHVLWQNLCHYFSNEAIPSTNGYMETHIEQKKNENPDLFLIRASMSALAASLSGTGSICIQPSLEDNTPLFYRRINRNIHHLLELESGMYKGVDPLSGAYSMDFHIKRWTTRIWDGLNFGT